MERFFTGLYNRKKVIFNNYSGLVDDEKSEINSVSSLIEEGILYDFKQGTNLLILIDVTNCFINGRVLLKFKEAASRTKKITEKMAVIGISDAKSMLLNAVNFFAKTNIKGFSKREDALEWLTS